MTQAKIYQPCKNAMQSGKAKTHHWVLEFDPAEPKIPDPIMGWAGSGDMNSQVRLKFDTLEEAENYAASKGMSYQVFQPHKPKLHIKAYSDNFRFQA